MPWKESHRVNERMLFVSRLLDGERMSDLCVEFGISRKTGYKFLDRFKELGAAGLGDFSRRPLLHPRKTSDEIERLVLELREVKPTWGPKKIKARLETLYPGIKVPAHSTIGTILDRHGVAKRKPQARRKVYRPTDLSTSQSPNDIWCVDFKGQFRLGSKHYCYPLTVTDHFSRYLLCCDALEDTKGNGVIASFEGLFSTYGLPKVILSDNGSPFASQSVAGLSRLSAWWTSLGIMTERIEPGHPEQNGRHERFHLTLKQEATRPAGRNILQQQEKFDLFKEDYNSKRPHEALNFATPADLYRPSSTKPESLWKDLEYPLCDQVLRVTNAGAIRLPKGRSCFIGRALSGHNIGLRQIEDKKFLAYFAALEIGQLDLKTLKFKEVSYEYEDQIH